jgi:GNAT superfamily N-acetyltransferase
MGKHCSTPLKTKKPHQMKTETPSPVSAPEKDRDYWLEIHLKGCVLQAGGNMGDSPRHFIIRATSQALFTEDDRHVVVGELTAELLRARTAEEYREDPIMTADAEEQELYEAAEEVYMLDHGCQFRSKFHRLEVFQGDMLLFKRLHVEPAHRGVNLGLEMMQQILDTVPHDLAVLFPRPLQYVEQDSEAAPRMRELYGMFDEVSEKAALQKLQRYYRKLGFERIGKKGYMFRSPLLENPPIKHDAKRRQAHLAKATMPKGKDEASLVADLQRAVANEKWSEVEAVARALQGQGGPRLPPNVTDISAARRR